MMEEIAMEVVSSIALLLAACAATTASEGFLPPWEEFKTLYRQSIEQEFAQKETEAQKTHLLYSIDSADYALASTPTAMLGEAKITGRILAGEPEPIPLFSNEIAVSEILEMTGGALFCAPDGKSLSFLPVSGEQVFHLSFRFMTPANKEEAGMAVAFGIPAAAQNSVRLQLPPEMQFVELPGIADEQGVYHFSARSQLRLVYAEKKTSFVAPPPVIELDGITRVRLEKNRLLLSSSFQPMRPAPEQLVIHVPEGAQFVASTLNASQWNKTAENKYTLAFPEHNQMPFSVDFVMDGRMENGALSFLLPFVENNTGMEGRFVVEEPEDGQVTVEAEGLIASISVEKLGEVLAAGVPKARHYMKAAVGTPIHLAYKPFQAISTPTIVLPSQELYVSFAENGAVLSVLRMSVPLEIGSRLQISAIEGVEIWSLTVNGVKQNVYTDEQNRWIIPLDGGQESSVELALLRQGEKLALHGALEAVMPETGLPSRELFVGIALPERVNLLSMEGSVNPASGEQCQPPAEFLGKPHFFSKSFYKGEGMTLSIAYKEPINQNQQ
jgi:hypothetical protein